MKSHKQIADLIVLSMMGAMIFAAKIAFEPLPNIHPIAMLVMVLTIVYRVKALVSVYIFALLLGLYNGFPVWWISHLYVWLILWAVTMLLPRNMSDRKAMIVYPIVCALHGFLYGTMWAPLQAIAFGFNFKQTLTWIGTGLPFDAIHGVSNLCMGMLVLPLVKAVRTIKDKNEKTDTK